YNRVAFGGFFTSGYKKYYGYFPYGFGENLLGTDHTLAKGLNYIWDYFNIMGVQSLFLPVHALIFIVLWILISLLYLSGCWKRKSAGKSPAYMDSAVFFTILIYAAAYIGYPVYNDYLGPRFFYPIIPFF